MKIFFGGNLTPLGPDLYTKNGKFSMNTKKVRIAGAGPAPGIFGSKNPRSRNFNPAAFLNPWELGGDFLEKPNLGPS